MQTIASLIQQSTTVKHPYKPSPAPLDNLNLGTATYEILDTGDSLDYTYPKPYNPRPGNAEVGRSAETTFSSDEDKVYHAVGPYVGVTNNTMNRSTLPPLHPPPVPARNGTGHEVIYHVLEEVLEESAMLYEEPTLPKFRVKLIVMIIMLMLIFCVVF